MEALVKAGQEAIQRFRYVFILISITGIIILSTELTREFTWLRRAIERVEAEPTAHRAAFDKAIIDSLYRDLYVASIPILGLKVSAFDIQVIGTIALAVLAIWFFVAARRENHVITTIGGLARKNDDPDCVGYLFHAVQHYFVLLPLTSFDRGISVEGSPETFFSGKLVRWAIKGITYIPVWVPVAAMVLDIVSLCCSSALYASHEALWHQLSPGGKVEMIIRFLICFALAAISYNWIREGWDFANDTHRQLTLLQSRYDELSRDVSPAPAEDRGDNPGVAPA